MTSAAMAGAGGLAGGLQTADNERAAATGNSSGFNDAGDIARERMKAASGASSGIASQNAQEKVNQQQSAAQGLSGLYNTDTSAQMKAMGLIPEDVNAQVNAGSHGWLQNMNDTITALSNAATGGANAKKAFA